MKSSLRTTSGCISRQGGGKMVVQPAVEAACFVEATANPKLAPVIYMPARLRDRPVPAGPLVSMAAVPIGPTCPRTCPFKSADGILHGCYAEAGFTKFQNLALERAAQGHTVEEILAGMAWQIDHAFGGGPIPQDGARGGRDLRLFPFGDVGSSLGAEITGKAATRYHRRGGGAIWTYSHWWRAIDRRTWGRNVAVLASTERAEDIEVARAAGYASAIVVPKFSSEKAFSLPGSSSHILPCRYQTEGLTCAECRWCFDDEALVKNNVTIGFQVHGPAHKRAEQALIKAQTESPLPASRLVRRSQKAGTI